MRENRQFLFILGAHRSGTSLSAAACDALGAKLGQRFIATSDENPKGFFEDEAIVALNDRILRSVDLSWDSFGYIWEEDFGSDHFRPYRDVAGKLLRERFADCTIGALKDPRLCLLLPFWKLVVAEALDVEVRVVLTVRDPEHCAHSQRMRAINDGDFHLLGHRREHVLLLWVSYYYHALRHIEAGNTLCLSYEALVADPAAELQRLADFVGVELDDDVSANFCSGFVDPSLARSAVAALPYVKRSPELWQWANAAYRDLLTLAARTGLEAAQIARVLEVLDPRQHNELYLRETQHMYGHGYKKVLSLRHRLIRCIGELGEERVRVAEWEKTHADLEQAYEVLDGRLEEILHSRAWRAIVKFRQYKARLARTFRLGNGDRT